MAASAAKGGGWMDTILNLIPGRRAAASAEPSEEAIKRTHDNLRCPPERHPAPVSDPVLRVWTPCDEALKPRIPAASCCPARPGALSQSGTDRPYVGHVVGLLVVCMAPWLWQWGGGSARCLMCDLCDVCREKAKGATFFEATEGETVRPMLDVAWAPMLGAFSVLFEEFPEGAPHHSVQTSLTGTLEPPCRHWV